MTGGAEIAVTGLSLCRGQLLVFVFILCMHVCGSLSFAVLLVIGCWLYSEFAASACEVGNVASCVNLLSTGQKQLC